MQSELPLFMIVVKKDLVIAQPQVVILEVFTNKFPQVVNSLLTVLLSMYGEKTTKTTP